MAVSSTTAAYMPHRELMPTLVKPTYSTTLFWLNNNITNNDANVVGTNNYVTLTRKAVCWRFLARSSDDGSETTATASDESWEGEGESNQIEMPKGPPSLISPLNIEKALRGIAITDADHYANLGLRRGCSYDQVRAAYETKVKEISSQEMDEEELNKELELLKESYVILSSEDERRLYDWSLARSGNPERYTWPFEVDITQTSDYGTPPPQEPEDVGPTIAVGYFILGWLILSSILSIALNR
ncbi:NAD(P)H-quinone oxidoreductase subunit U, chloroplastic-like [Chenopodium quinoa]|uniref:J domain-containing protein n=1 Tax=Chenopodium quinoa TaxID=63459 RepID=A0A803LYN1_CHEQI|nr:NAD(P)H-quinone oxidoreductase subunit U, chloroplastic-like [Chenopodium quinoa]